MMRKENSRHRRILVADDDGSILDIFSLVVSHIKPFQAFNSETEKLEGKGFQANAFGQSKASFDLVTCRQADEAVNAVKIAIDEDHPFAVAFIDVRMPPGPDGIWAAEHIRALDPDVEVVIITGYSDSYPTDLVHRIPPAHKLLYLQKPIHIQEIFQFISALSMKWHTECELREINQELEQRVEERTNKIKKVNEKLRLEISERLQAEEALRASEGKLNAMLRSIADPMSMMDKDLNITWANETAMRVFGNDIVGKKCYEAYHRKKEPCDPYPCLTLKAFQDGSVHGREAQVIDKDGQILSVHCTANVALRDKEGNPTAVIEVLRDITDYKRVLENLKKARDELEFRVMERSKELNEALKIMKRDEKELIKHKSELEEVNKQLMETNQALSVLARNIDKDKEIFEERIHKITASKIMPIIRELQNDPNCRKRQADLEVLATYLSDFTSGPTRNHEIDMALSEQEFRVAVMIKNGLTSPKIADMLNISLHTVKTHRKNIRKKLKIQNKEVNLTSYMKSTLKK
jgi:PAS domain S-box-containing protein